MENLHLKKTPLYEEHLKLNARMVPFTGWNLPVQYSQLVEEHQCVRKNVGIFDVSHMGEFTCEGRGSSEFLQTVTINDISKMEIGHAQYNAICNEKSGVIDDIIVYKRGFDSYFICVNASNIEKDFLWLQSHLPKQGVSLTDVSNDYAQIAIQGPKSFEILKKIVDIQAQNLKYYHFTEGKILGVPSLIARTGYTGELGYEIYIPSNSSSKIWRTILEIGQAFNLKPCGLGCRDTLRLEMGYLLYGNDMDENVSAIECGLSWITKLDKGNFIGKSAILQQKELNHYRRLVGFEMLDKSVGRHGYLVYADLESTNSIGVITSGSPSPTLGKNIGYCLVDKDFSSLNKEVYIQIRNDRKKAKIVKKTFYTNGTANNEI